MSRLVAWGREHDDLLVALNTDAQTMAHVGGPETLQKIAERQVKYSADPRQFAICDDAGTAVGWVGYWERDWRDVPAFECGWSLVAAARGQGLASSGTRELVARAQADDPGRPLHAFPSVENLPSNAICRAAGFELLGEIEFEYPPGHMMRCHDWRVSAPA